MALYMLQAKYTPEAIRNITESGSNREDAARAVVEPVSYTHLTLPTKA